MKLRYFLLIGALVCDFFITYGTAQALQSIVPKSGQTMSYAKGDDGDLTPGAGWPGPRFTNNNNGTITDNLTGLIWLQNANCSATLSGVDKITTLTWTNALTWSNGMVPGSCTLTDGSATADWRLPDRLELESLIDASNHSPALPTGHPFSGVQERLYWSSSSNAANPSYAWAVSMYGGNVNISNKKDSYNVWPVRGGQFGNSAISVAPLSINYGNVDVGGSSQPVIISNIAAGGSSRLQINAITLLGAEFSINPGNGSDGTCGRSTPTLDPGDSCNVTVNFNPTSPGVKSATLRVSGSDVNAPNVNIPLTGTGIGYNVTGSVSGGNGTIDSANPANILSGSTATFILAPDATYQPVSSVTGTCPAGSWNGNSFTTGAVTADCTVGFTFTKITYPLILTFQGTGGGTVSGTTTGSPSSLNYLTNGSDSITMGSVVTLTPYEDGSSVFSGWSGCPAVNGNQCIFNMTAAHSLSAYFNLLSGGNVKANGSTYGTVSSGLSNVLADGELALKTGDFYEVLTLNRAFSYTLRGGYDGGFTAASGMSTVRGSISITAGTVTIDNIVIL